MEELTLDELKILEKSVKQRIAALKPKRGIDLAKIRSRVELENHYDGPQWQRELVSALNAQIQQDFSSFFDLFVGIQTANDCNWSNINCANRFNSAYVLYIDKLIAEKRLQIQESLPKSKISVVFNPATDKYECVEN